MPVYKFLLTSGTMTKYDRNGMSSEVSVSEVCSPNYLYPVTEV